MKVWIGRTAGWAVAAGMLAAAWPAAGNNLRVTNVALKQQDAGAKTVVIEFDLSWRQLGDSIIVAPLYGQGVDDACFDGVGGCRFRCGFPCGRRIREEGDAVNGYLMENQR